MTTPSTTIAVEVRAALLRHGGPSKGTLDDLKRVVTSTVDAHVPDAVITESHPDVLVVTTQDRSSVTVLLVPRGAHRAKRIDSIERLTKLSELRETRAALVVTTEARLAALPTTVNFLPVAVALLGVA